MGENSQPKPESDVASQKSLSIGHKKFSLEKSLRNGLENIWSQKKSWPRSRMKFLVSSLSVGLLARLSSLYLANPLHPTCSALLAKLCAHYTVSDIYFSLSKFCTLYIHRFKLHRKQFIPLPSDVKDHRLFELGILESIVAIKLYHLFHIFKLSTSTTWANRSSESCRFPIKSGTFPFWDMNL